MKNLTLAFGLLVTLSTAQSFALDITANQFEYFHCTPNKAKNSDSVVHYVLNVQNVTAPKLYVTSALKSTKAKDLKSLSLIDKKVNTNVVAENIDVQWRSVKNDIDMQLVIRSNEGELMLGQLINKSQSVEIRCIDAALEN